MHVLYEQVQPEMALCAAKLAATSEEPDVTVIGAIQLTVLAGFRGTGSPNCHVNHSTVKAQELLAHCFHACTMHVVSFTCTSFRKC